MRKQKSGGPIGLALTGDLADCYLIEWDKKFINKMKSLGLELILYERFKDDITLIAEIIEGGFLLEKEKILLMKRKRWLMQIRMKRILQWKSLWM